MIRLSLTIQLPKGLVKAKLPQVKINPFLELNKTVFDDIKTKIGTLYAPEKQSKLNISMKGSKSN
jgi:hypothetical protein